MSIDEKTDKPAATEPAATDATTPAGARRRIVRSASTRAAEAAAAEAAAAAKAAEPAAEAAPAPKAAPAEKPAAAPAEHTPKRFDVRAAKPTPATTPKTPIGERPWPTRADGPRGDGARKPWAPRNDGRPEGGRPPRRDARPDGRGPRPPRVEDKPLTWTDAHPATRSDARPPTGPRNDAPRARPETARPRAEAPKAKPAAPPAPPPKPAKPVNQPILALPGKARAVQQPAAKPAPTAKEALAAKTARLAQAGAQPKAKTSDRPVAADAGAFSPEQLGAGIDGAVAAVKAAGERGVSLVDAWTVASNAAALVAVADANDVASAPRKAARRALNVLKARGVELPTQARTMRVAEASAPAAIEAMFQPPDPTGAVSFSITSREPGGRFHIAEVIAREPAGIVQAAGGWLSGTQLREGRARAASSLGVAPVAVPVEWARYRIAALRKQNAASGQVIPLGFDACRELVEPAPEAEPAHPMGDLDATITSEKAWALAPASRTLHDEPEFRSWLPDRGAVDELLMKLGERLGPDGVKDPEKVNDAMREEIESATDRFFSPEIRGVVAARMRDAAISIRARRGDDRATDVLGAAKAVVEAGLITSPPREIPFLVAFFQKAIGFLAQQGQLRVPVRGPEAVETQATT